MVRRTDYVGQIVDYIIKNLKKGYTKESLKWALVDQGHSKMEIERAFIIAERQLAQQAPVLKTKPLIKHEIIYNQDEKINVETKKSFWKRFFSW